MADELSLLWRIRADASQVKTATAESRAAVAQLRQSFGPELTQTVSVANKAFSDIASNLNIFVGQRLPLVGGAFVRVTENIRGFGDEAKKQEGALKKIAESITDLSNRTGKSVPQLTAFLTQFAKIGTQASRDNAALKFFGAEFLANNPKLVTELEKTATGLSEIAVASVGARSGLAALAGPIGIAVLALGALALGAAAVVKQLFDITKQAAEFQGKMFDLAQQTGVAVETLSALEIVARTTGGELGGSVLQSLVAFQRKLDDAQDPLSKTGQLFRDLQINTSDTETALRAAFIALAGMEVGFVQTNAAAELFGARGGKQILAILKETNGDLDAAIKRFRELGILISEEDARAADKLNDELAILHFQFRAATGVIAKELIPALTDIVRSFGDLLTASRPILRIFTEIAGIVARGLASAFRGLRIVIALVTGDYIALAKAAKEANEAIKPPELERPRTTEGPRPTLLTASIGPDIIAQTDAVVAAAKRAAETTNQALDELFQQGRRNRAQQGEELIAANKKLLDAERLQIEERIKLKDEEVKALREREDLGALERDKGIQEAFNEATKLREDLRTKETAFAIETRQIRLKVSKENADARRNQIANETDQLVGEFDRQIKEIESAIKRGETVESDGLTIIEQLEQGKIDARKESLEKQKEVGFLTIQAQEEINAEIRKVIDEGDRLRDEQRQRRLERERETAERTRDILISNLDALLEIERVQGEARIATLQTLAALRVKTEEDAAKEILRIRLDLIDSEIEATRAKLSAASSISDGGERERIESELNNQIKILQAQRKATQEQGNRDIDGARQEDLNNAREYARDLEEIHIRIAEIERNAAEEVLRLMVIHFASRRDIIRARLQLDIEDENARHQNALQGIAALRQENAESNRTKQEKLEQEKEINRLEEVEELRHQLALKAAQGQAKKEERDVQGIFVPGNLLPNVEEGAGAIANVTAGLKAAFAEVKTIGMDALGSLAQGIGSLVQNYVLLGETGPAALRKLLAATLAQIAAESAVKAIYWTAQGIADLFFNPARAAADFTAAALFASIAGVAAVAGRSVAGDLFKPKTSSSDRDSSPPRPLDTVVERGRNQQTIVVQLPAIQVNPNDRFGQAVTATWADDFNNGGISRQTIDRDGR